MTKHSIDPVARGFTLVEAVATMTILAVVSVAASRIIFTAADNYAGSAVRSELSASASAAMERIAFELRRIPSRDGAPGVPRIDSVTPAAIAWGGNSTLAHTGTALTLMIDGGAPRTLLGDVQAFSIACFDSSNQPLAANLSGSACDAVRRIELTLTLSRAGASETLRTRVFPRSAAGGGQP
jgi:prepilin-type N-terminal cleavage/methylation domain-containing protein